MEVKAHPMVKNRPVKAYEFDEFVLDLELRSLTIGSRTLKLNAKAFDLLQLLIEKRGTVIDKNRLLEHVWPDRIVEEGNVSVHIFTLRKILNSGLAGRNYIETVPGTGYRFVARVTEVFDRAVGAKFVLPDPGAPIGSEPFELLVLPFRGHDREPETGYYATGFTESLINSLSQLPTLRVLASQTVGRYQGWTGSAQQIGQALGVRALVTGVIDKSDGELIIDIELLDVEQGVSWWRQRYTGQAIEIFNIQRSIALELTKQLRSAHTGVDKLPVKRPATGDLEAYRHFLKGQYWVARRTCANLEKAIRCFQSAIARDPGYALAYIHLADTFMVLSGWGCVPFAETILPAQRALEQALAIDRSVAATHSSHGFFKIVYRIDWASAEADFRRAIALDPTFVRAQNRYSMLLKHLGRFEEARKLIHRAFALDPLSFILYGQLADTYFLSRDFEQALGIANEILPLDPVHGDMSFLIGKTLCELGRFDEALAVLSASDRSDPHPDLATQICITHARAGDAPAARTVLEKLQQRSVSEHVEAWNFALMHASLHEPDLAFAYFDRALEERNVGIYLLRWDPRVDSLRDDVRFSRIERQIGYPD
jgi:DNA-binding winged helix-turn-helix (wHTH) protein/TolB-like protein/Tfp pilus assembly protein PilF